MNKSTLALTLSLVAAASAQAQTTPYYLGATQAFTHTSNVRSAAEGTPIRSDNISETTLLGGLSLPFGRQRAYADGRIGHIRHNDADDLDNTAYDVRLGLDWATIGRLSGGLVVGSTQTLSQLNPGNAPEASRRNMERVDSVEARARFGGDGRLALDGSLGWRQVDYSAFEFRPREYDQTSASVGLSYRPRALLTLSTGIAGQRTKYPRYLEVTPGEFLSDRGSRRDVYVSAVWTPTAISTVAARLAHAKVEFDRETVNDYSGLIGSLAWTWQPTGRLQLITTATRDTGRESSFAAAAAAASGGPGSPTTPSSPTTPGTTPGVPSTGDSPSAADFSRVSNALAVRARYELTAKVRVDAEVAQTRRGLASETLGRGSDRSTLYALGATWEATRAFTFGCTIGRDQRRSSTVLSSDTTVNTYGCFGSIMLR